MAKRDFVNANRVALCVCFQERGRGRASVLGPVEGAHLHLQVEPLLHRLPLPHLHPPPGQERQRLLRRALRRT